VWQGPDPQDKTAIALDVNSGKTKLLNGHLSAITAIAVAGNGRLALTLSFDSAIVWDLETGQQARSFKAPFGTLRAAMDPGGQLALFSGFDGKVTLFDVERATLRITFDGGFRFVGNFAISKDSNFAVVCGDDDSLTVWSTADGAKIARLFLSSSVTALAMSQNFILLGDAAGRLYSLRLETAQQGN
jgi:WD40 repeat protein